MKSKLLKLKEMSVLDWCLVLMCIVGCISVYTSAVRNDWSHSLVAVSYVLAVVGWMIANMKAGLYVDLFEDLVKKNNELISVNDKLVEDYNNKLLLCRGVMSENKELKLKLKNAKMENSRLRKKGGNKNE